MHERYIVQGIQSNILITFEESFNDKDDALDVGEKLLKTDEFEGDSVRIITFENELVWESSRPI